MHRRSFLISLILLAACASAPAQIQHEPAQYPPGFQSDRIIVTAQGSGPDVILIPGLTSSSSVWDTTVSALVSTHRVHVVQVRGFAGTDAAGNAEGPVSAPVAEEIARYIAENHLDHPAIIGHSMGGTIGMMLAARHPDAVGRLMVVDMFPFMGAMFGGQTAEAVRPVADQMRSQMLAAPPGSAGGMIEQMIANMTQTESARPALVQQARDSNRTVVANAFHELIVTDLRPELANIRAPVTVLYVIPPQAPVTPEQYVGHLEMSYATLPNKRIVRIDDSYHFIMIDAFERFMSEVNAFLAS
jgi:pimeloyl-ACP methyl ester carboxylesterase